MKRALPFLVLAAVVAGLIIAFRVLEGQRTPDWQVALDVYIEQGVAPSSLARITVRLVDRATRPRNFRPGMGRPVPTGWQWKSVELPWPPEELVCVLVETVRPEGEGMPKTTAYGVLFVARHTDLLWRDGWIVHEGAAAPFSRQLEQDLSSVGCDVALERVRQLKGGASAAVQSAMAG